jgi:hypothetical protein
MLTLELKAHFQALAVRDHLSRMESLLTGLDVGQRYAIREGFPEEIREWVAKLDAAGIRSAYHQGCVLFSVLAWGVRIESIPPGLDAPAQAVHCVSQALLAGAPVGAFHHIHRVLSGVGCFDEPWLQPQGEPDCLNALPQPPAIPSAIDLPCVPDGPLTGSQTELLHQQATFLRTASGLQHRLSAQHPLSGLLSQVCQKGLSSNPWRVNLHPVFEQCEIGFAPGKGFIPAQTTRLVDARQARLSFHKRDLALPHAARQGLELRWRQSALLREATQLSQALPIQADLDFSAGWTKNPAGFSFATRGNLSIHLAAGSLQWHGSLVHEGCLVQLGISMPHDLHMDWVLDEDFPAGQLPLGTPLLTRQHIIPLNMQLVSALCVGKPVPNLVNPEAGSIRLRLVVLIDPETRCLGLFLELGHSPLVCEWQTVDPLLAWTSGRWDLSGESTIHSWNLQHG